MVGPIPPDGIQLRAEREDDGPFLFCLYASTREAELSLVDWSAEQKQTFVTMQFHAQRQHYRETYPDARFDVIEREGEPIGRICVLTRDDEIRVVDIALVPASRSHGLGTALMSALLDQAASTQRRVTMHVARFNPALRLYQRLGFRPIEDKGAYFLMEARPLPR